MPEHLPPTIDPIAAARWHALLPGAATGQAAGESPWLHEEVARRMQERLPWLVQKPVAWCDWDPLRGGLQGHALVAAQYPQAISHWVETSSPQGQARLQAHLARPWWSRSRWTGQAARLGLPEAGSVQLLWANMALHMAADPRALMQQWQRALAVGGYLMFSCLGPDTLRELRALYAQQGWPAPSHSFTDMHDWGDMLLQAGFAEPVMDMERITLTFASPERLLQELRGLGRNLQPQRFAGLRGRGWLQRLHQGLRQQLVTPGSDGTLALTFEIVYGHAIKAAPRVPVGDESTVSLQDMRAMLRAPRA